MNEKIKAWLQERWLFLSLSVVVLAIALIAIRVNLRFWHLDTVGSDTYYSWIEGRRILRGQNPYERILHGNMQENGKYSTYFPLFYELSALMQFGGIRQYYPWISVWRYVFLACNLAIGVTLFALIFSKRTWALALLAIPFWYFNRWTLLASWTVALDFIPIFLMVLSLGIFDKYRKTSLLLYGISLAIKQIAIFLAPLYLIWEYQETRSLKKTFIAGLWIISIPLLSSIPFLLWNVEGFVKSIAFSATRDALTHFAAQSIDVVLNLNGLPARVPFLLMLCGVYFAAWQKSVGRYGSAMLVMGIFIAFNSILFSHYPAWLMALLPLAACELILLRKENPDL
ncbi:MAG TPA: hypothetical protein VJ785_06205 [Anaerolineales bacterium]|nr:hypothetical protein [Anaerolineales bacterium]